MANSEETVTLVDNEEVDFINVPQIMILSNELPTFDEDFQQAKKNYWKNKIKNIKKVVAPMVDQSELAFRMLLRDNGSDLCYTPMLHAQLFTTNSTYRSTALASCSQDRPLIVQFCANDARTFVDACRMVEGICDGVDLNLGCPQIIAKKGHYGAYLQEEPELIRDMVSLCYKHCRLPISVKIRRLDTDEETLAYAKMLDEAGASLLTLHGRTRDMRGPHTGIADWNIIKKIKESLSIPVIANGNIQMPGDVEKCINETGADAVMSAEGILSNPMLFNETLEVNFKVCLLYLDYANKYRANLSAVRAHVFRTCHYSWLVYNDLRDRVAHASSIEMFVDIVKELEKRIIQDNPDKDFTKESWLSYKKPEHDNFFDEIFALPHWFSKPYIRPFTDDTKPSSTEYRATRRDNLAKIAELAGLSKRYVRKCLKRQIKVPGLDGEIEQKKKYIKCEECNSPAGTQCDHTLCKKCCKARCKTESIVCKIHFKIKV
ncbi:tRNA-dihydrouridine(16/17) synthase [NAD(P)(+)]-like [Strongyloides ratti]|uniref:tRNA-dihydrouridine(16/17) synthase [NAD(P)(+)] n=1 Tax=Strongyloides ratti TaxID=34506 RepID=A0A090LFE2_STRRB|nr:tRNA-dihydrouridine(16/17) synthase [NAD(P)(+)]-like [Strongyloides ratti]CEF66868.1 tRNA-dihydrouridine(16/17) synthase [NAD(P)(+)]-like [Strongyloides ratti]